MAVNEQDARHLLAGVLEERGAHKDAELIRGNYFANIASDHILAAIMQAAKLRITKTVRPEIVYQPTDEE